MRRDELKPCPFCGSDRVTVWNIRDGQQAVCKECKSTSAPTFHGPDGPKATWGHAVEAWNRRAAPPEETASDDLIGYVLRYGGMCRDCADMDGVCQSGQPCDVEQRRAVVKHTIAALAYGIEHGFIASPFPPLSTALSIEQTQPAAWMYQFKTKTPVLMVEKRNWAETHSEWTETPLYAHPPTTRIADSAEAGGSATLSSGVDTDVTNHGSKSDLDPEFVTPAGDA